MFSFEPRCQGAGGVAEVDLHVGSQGEGFMSGHFRAWSKVRNPRGCAGGTAMVLMSPVADCFSGVVIREVDEHQVAGRAVEQGCDR